MMTALFLSSLGKASLCSGIIRKLLLLFSLSKCSRFLNCLHVCLLSVTCRVLQVHTVSVQGIRVKWRLYEHFINLSLNATSLVISATNPVIAPLFQILGSFWFHWNISFTTTSGGQKYQVTWISINCNWKCPTLVAELNKLQWTSGGIEKQSSRIKSYSH